MRQIEQFRQGHGVAVVLMQRILERGLLAKHGLRPSRLFLVPKNPAIHVFRFDYENPEDRNDNMVNLRRPSLCFNDQIVNTWIGRAVQRRPHAKLCESLSEPSFEDTHQGCLAGEIGSMGIAFPFSSIFQRFPV